MAELYVVEEESNRAEGEFAFSNGKSDGYDTIKLTEREISLIEAFAEKLGLDEDEIKELTARKMLSNGLW